MKIKNVSAREILDSRGNPTVECVLVLDSGQCVRASVPSGASVGEHEAVELRDGDPSRYRGRGVQKVIKNIETIIAPAIVGRSPDVGECDKIMLELDGTVNKARLGANAILAVSIAVARAQALCQGVEVYQLIQQMLNETDIIMPSVMFNILNGGAHADNKIAFQEFMIMPMEYDRFADALHIAVSIYQKLKELLVADGLSTGVGDEGGFAPTFSNGKVSRERQALNFLRNAVEAAGYELGRDVVFCLDVAASNFFSKEEGVYCLHKEKLKAQGMIDIYKDLMDEYPIYSIEDGLDENDWEGWECLTDELGKNVLLVGDDIFVSTPTRIARGIEKGVANAVLIKPNQIGTVSQTLEAIALCKKHNYEIVVSHRSGETCDTFISDLVVGSRSSMLKAGAPARGERIAKYNRLLEVEGA